MKKTYNTNKFNNMQKSNQQKPPLSRALLVLFESPQQAVSHVDVHLERRTPLRCRHGDSGSCAQW